MDGLSGIVDALGMGGGSAPAPLWQQLLTGGMFGMGELGNIMEEHKRSKYQDFVMSLLTNPSQLAKMATSTAAPLSQALIQSVGNQVQGDMASRGLAQAPGVFAASETQALAPFMQQNYNTALQAILQTLGLPAGTFAPPQNMSPAMSQFLRTFGTPGASTSTNPVFNVPFDPGSTWSVPQNPTPPGLTPPMFPDLVPPPETVPNFGG